MLYHYTHWSEGEDELQHLMLGIFQNTILYHYTHRSEGEAELQHLQSGAAQNTILAQNNCVRY